MADLGAITEIVNASELTLEVGSDSYVMLTNLNIHIGRTEDRIATTDAGALYTYGKSENFFTATLVLTTPELIDTNAVGFNKLTQIDADGDMTARSWKIVGRNLAAATITWAATGILKEYDVRKSPEGKIEVDIFVRITGDTVAIT